MNTKENDQVEHVVLTLHGIRDLGGWQDRARDLIEAKIPNSKCLKVDYDWFDPLSFLSPFPSSRLGPYQNFHKRYENAKKRYPNAKISVVAHSFGTFLVGELLKQNPNAIFHRIILAGSVLKRDYNWKKVRSRFGVGVAQPNPSVMNEKGNKDPWPTVASIVHWRYGKAGSIRFINGDDDIGILEKDYEGGHGVFLTDDHITHYWLPFLQGDNVPSCNARPREQLSFVERAFKTIPGLSWLVRIPVMTMQIAISFWWLSLPLLLCWMIFVPSPEGKVLSATKIVVNKPTEDEVWESIRTIAAIGRVDFFNEKKWQELRKGKVVQPMVYDPSSKRSKTYVRIVFPEDLQAGKIVGID